jgi:glutamate synthase (ferredoxin)
LTERSLEIPLYDPRFEHDACGVGFVADAGGRNRERVLPLALTGLASLGHRGAFAADGESSDGAGVALPLERPLLGHIAPGLPARTAVVMLFLPPSEPRTTAARALVEDALASQQLPVARWRDVPIKPAALGVEARSTTPVIAQALVPRPPGTTGRLLERRLLLARRRMESAARAAQMSDFAVASASARTVVYKGLVAGSRLSDFYPDLARPLPLSYAIFHQRYATNTTPRWGLAQPFRVIAHNGEINTVRGNREQFRGRAGSLGGTLGRELLGTGPLLSPDGSDSLSLDEAIELLLAGGRPLEEILLELMPESLAVRGSPHPRVYDFQRLLGGRVAPWDGPAAVAFADGRRVGAILDRNGLRPAAVSITRDALVAVASEAGAVPIPAAETSERRRLGPGEMLLVDPGRGKVWRDAEAKTESLRRLPPAAVDRPEFLDVPPPPAESRAPSAIRWLAGLDAERLRLSVRTMALEGAEPLWSMGDDTPTPALGRLDRPVTDHLRQSFAQVTNPPIDPERERVVMDLAVDLGRRAPLLQTLPARPPTLRLARPFVADVPGLVRTFERSRSGSRTKAPLDRTLVLDATWPAAAGPSGLGEALDRLAAEALTAARGRTELLVVSDRALGPDRPPIPSVLATGAIQTALTVAGVRGEVDLLVEAADVLDVHAAAMALACGATAVSPWLALELAAEQAGSRGAEALTPQTACENLLAALDKGLRKVLARMGISTAASYIGGQFFEVLELDRALAERCFPAAPIWPGSVGLQVIAERQLRRLAQSATLPAGDRLPDPGFVRYRSDGEIHLYAPPVVRAMGMRRLKASGCDRARHLEIPGFHQVALASGCTPGL